MSTMSPTNVTAARDDRMPPGVPYIVSNEFAERFCFYGINSILTIYLVQFLHFTDAQGASWQSLFKSGAYFFPMVGAIVADVFWGKFKTIMVFSIAYCLGCVSLALFSETPLAIGLGLLPSYWLFWRKPLLPEHASTRKYLTCILAIIAWWAFLVGHVVNNLRGVS